VPKTPSFVKSRPIQGDNTNSILLNMDSVRHFIFVDDKLEWDDKKDLLIGRAAVHQEHRERFYKMWFGHPMCDLGHVNKNHNKHPQWSKPLIGIDEHLEYKFVLCLEGNDVASNLKWVMSSNSIAVMPRPTYETWFMEGTLVGGRHYIEIKSDYSDLEEKLRYYIDHPDEAREIISHAHAHVARFRDKRREKLISYLVAQKYFKLTNAQELAPSYAHLRPEAI
jgi:hypothetical protein